MIKEGNFAVGCGWGILLAIPLWIFIGWIVGGLIK